MGRFTKAIDGIYAALAPERAIRRHAARRTLARVEKFSVDVDRRRRERESFSAGGYQSAEQSRDAKSWLTSRLSPDSALEADREEMCRRADSAYKNYELATNHVEGRVVRVAGSGMTVEPEIGSEKADEIAPETGKAWNEKLRVNWERVSERIGRDGEELWEIQHSLQRNYERRMEWFLLIGDEYDPLSPVTLKVEVINPDRVSTPPDKEGDVTIRMGIQLSPTGRRIGCYVQDSHPGDSLDVKQTWTYYPFYLPNGLPRMIHHFIKIWDGQHRGYPRMQVGLKRLKNSEEYADAELERNYIAACFAAFVRSDMDPDDAQESMGVVTSADGTKESEIKPGRILYTGFTDQIEFSKPDGPTATFAPFMEHEGRAFAAGAGTFYELLSGDWRGLSYSAARVIWNVEEATTAVIQLGHEKTIKWLYRHFVTQAIRAGIIDADMIAYRSNPWPYWASRVVYPPKASIDPAREDRNEMVQVEGCMKPGSEMVERLNGKPARQVYAAIKRDRELREEYGLEIHLPQMGRDQELMPESEGSGPTQPGDTNQKSSDANSDRQAVAA